jgi:heme/copper-type cytochrome/quinol oxidase subunit 3
MTERAHNIPDKPMPNGLLGMYLFLASEAMFFLGILGSFLVLQSGQRELFHHMASTLSRSETALLAVLLVLASVTVKRRWIAIIFAIGFALFQLLIWQHLLNHHTIVQRNSGHAFVYDGELDVELEKPHRLKGVVANLPNNFDVTQTTITDIKQAATSTGEFQIVPADVLQDVSLGPWRNNFFASYYLITGAHLVHLLAGIIAMIWLALRSAPSAVNISCVRMYFHFVNIVGVLGLLLLYFA